MIWNITYFQDSREQLEKVRQIKIFQYKYKPEFVSLSDEDQRKSDWYIFLTTNS